MNNLLIVFLFFFLFKDCLAESFLSDDLKEALMNAYNNNPRIKSERARLYETDELYPQALSSFRPEIEGFYNKGKTDTSTSEPIQWWLFAGVSESLRKTSRPSRLSSSE